MKIESEKLPVLIQQAVRSAFGPAGWAALSDDDRRLIEACTADAAAVQLLALAAAGDARLVDRVRREKSHVDAQLASLRSASASAAASILWAVTSRMLSRAAATVLAA
jgi:hypothetical protein